MQNDTKPKPIKLSRRSQEETQERAKEREHMQERMKEQECMQEETKEQEGMQKRMKAQESMQEERKEGMQDRRKEEECMREKVRENMQERMHELMRELEGRNEEKRGVDVEEIVKDWDSEGSRIVSVPMAPSNQEPSMPISENKVTSCLTSDVVADDDAAPHFTSMQQRMGWMII